MKIHVISFNLRCFDDPNGHSIAERAPRLRKILPGYDADILCFQEITQTWQTHLEKDYTKEYEMYLQYRNSTGYLEGLSILWKKDKFHCLKKGCFWLSDTPEVESRGWDELYDCFRICAYAILQEKESGKSFVVMNTHYGFGDKGQIDSCNLIHAYSKKISDLPTFVAGDFNMTPSTPGYAAMTQLFRDVNACTAKDLRVTFHGYGLDTVTPTHIDYCFIDEQITPVDHVMITDTVDGKFPSDHYGIQFLLEI